MVRTGHGTTDWFQYCHPAYLTYMQGTSWEILDWKKHKLESRLLREISIISDTQMTPPLMAESEEELKSLLMKVKEKNEKNGLKTQHSGNWDHGIGSHHVMANRWRNNGNSEKLYFPGLQNHCRWWLKSWNYRCLLLGRKAMTNLDSILKSETLLYRQRSV